MKSEAKHSAKLDKADKKEQPTTATKKFWWKFWGLGKKVNAVASLKSDEPTSQKTSEDLSLPVSRRLSDKEKMESWHNELLNSVDKVCQTLEEIQALTIEFKAGDILPPIPVENLDGLTRSNDQVSGMLHQVSGWLESVGNA